MKINKFVFVLFLFTIWSVAIHTTCRKVQKEASTGSITYWITTADQGSLFQKSNTTLPFLEGSGTLQEIRVDTGVTYQSMDGFGYTLTGGSAMLIGQLPPAQRTSLLNELFGKNEGNIGISFLRVSMGASDLDASVFSYNDLPAGQTDPQLTQFSIQKDKVFLVPLLKEILQINPSLRFMATPWSPPVWMKDNNNSIGGSLLPAYYGSYAQYFVKYIQAMKAEGITIHYLTPQNEPLHPGNNPSMYMTAAQQAAFIKDHLGPALQAAAITTRIVIYDHNADRPDYPIDVLNDPAARTFIDGSAFHLYAGDVSALSTVHNAYPDKHIYFTEQWTGANGSFAGDLRWHLKNVIIGSARNWSRVALEWNLANDPSYGPHTPGGCTECKGALTIGNTVNRNVSYYIIAHVSAFVPPGSVRVDSNMPATLPNVAFKTPAGKTVLVVLNDGNNAADFHIRAGGKKATATLPSGAVATYVW